MMAVDVELSVDLGRGATLSIGGQNVLDTYSHDDEGSAAWNGSWSHGA